MFSTRPSRSYRSPWRPRARDVHQREGREILHLRHKFGSKWSAFIENYVASMFREILDHEPKVESLDNAVTIYINERTA